MSVDTCSGGEAWRWRLPGGGATERIGLHGNNKSDAEIDRAVAAGIGRVIVDGIDEIGARGPRRVGDTWAVGSSR